MNTVPNSDFFRGEVERIMSDARAQGKEYVEILSGDVHRNVGGYPSTNHRMASCCEVMYSMMKPSDKVISAPKKGKGATLKIGYYL